MHTQAHFRGFCSEQCGKCGKERDGIVIQLAGVSKNGKSEL